MLIISVSAQQSAGPYGLIQQKYELPKIKGKIYFVAPDGKLYERNGNIFVTNLMFGDKNYNRPLLFVWQPADHCKRVSSQQFKQIDHNVSVRDFVNEINPLILWSPAENEKCQQVFASPHDLQKIFLEFGTYSRYFVDYHGPLFKSVHPGDYELLTNFPGINSAAQLPDKIKYIINQSEPYIGAFPPFN